MIVRVESNDEELELEPNDMGLILRDGHICLKSPDHEVGENVPEDFLVFVGIATVFHVEGFREQMLQIVQLHKPTGIYADILGSRPKSN